MNILSRVLIFRMPGAAVCMCEGNAVESRAYLHASSDVLSSSVSVMPMNCELVIVSSLEGDVAVVVNL